MSGLSLPRSSSPSVHSTSPTETTAPATTVPNAQTPPTPTQQNSEQFAGLRRSRSASESRTAQPGQGRRRTASLSGPSTASATASAPTLSSLASTVAAEHDAAAQELEAPPTPHTEQAPVTPQTVAREQAAATEEAEATEQAVAGEQAPATTQTVAKEEAPATEQAVVKEQTPATVQTPADTAAPSVPVPVSERPLTLHHASSESDMSPHMASSAEMTRSSSAGATPASTAPLESHAPVASLAPPPSDTALQETAAEEVAPKETAPQETTPQKTAPQETAKAVESAPPAKESEPATPLTQVPERSLTLHQAASESDLPMEEAPSSTPAPAMTRSSSTGATAASTAPLEPPASLAPPAALSIHVTVPQETGTTPTTQNEASSSKTVAAETSTTPATQNEASSSKTATAETSTTLTAQPEVSTLQEVTGRTRSESTTTVRDFAFEQKPSSSSLETKQPTPQVTVSAPAVESAPAALSTASSTPALTDVAPAPLPQTPLQTPPQAHLAPPLQKPADKPAITTTQATASSSTSTPLEITVEPRVPAKTQQQGTLADPKVKNFVKHTRIAAKEPPPTSTVRLGNRATGRNATAVDNDIDLEAGGPPVRERFDQTRSRIGAFTKPVMSMVRGAPAMLAAAPGALKAGLIRVKNNDFGEDQPWLGWSANVVNTVVHELFGTGGTTELRELADLGMAALIDATGMKPAHQAIGVGVIFGAAVGGNLVAMYHKSKKGTATTATQRGHMIQVASLLLSATAAGLVGKDGKKGPILAQILPQALKSVVYLTRDLYNLQFPLEGNHDADYDKPILGQSLDVLYGGVEMAVNAAQDRGLGGGGVLEALKAHTMGLKEIIGKNAGYVLANAGGESIANISVRVANEIATHGPGSKEALKGIRDLRLSWGKFSAEQTSKGSQLVDKLEGAATARLSLFLSLYAFSGVLGHLLENSGMNAGKQQALEEVLGGIMIFAGCIPFAMSTSGKSPDEEMALSDVASDDADHASVTVTPADPNLAPERPVADPGRLSPNTAGLRPQNSSSSSASINTVSSGRPSFEVV